MEIPTHTQVLVIGGGPAGSSASALLAQNGLQVTLLERDVFPRYHIGESLIVSCREMLDITGAEPKVAAANFLKKSGAVLRWGGEDWEFNWAKSLSGKFNYAYQVTRSEFDQILLNHSRDVGVKVFQPVGVKDFDFDPQNDKKPIAANWSTGKKDDGSYREGKITFDYLIDASGRAGIMVNKYLKTRKFNDSFKNIGIWGYYEAIDKSYYKDLENPIQLESFTHGWTWVIPIEENKTSIGVVMNYNQFNAKRNAGMSKEEIFKEIIDGTEATKPIIKNANLISEIRTESDYSYYSSQVAGPNYFVCGDAGCFLDPLLSSGVHLALYSALLASASLISIIKGTVTQEQGADYYTQAYLQHYTRWLIVVSSFSAVAAKDASKENLFWQTQNLVTDSILDNQNMKKSFTMMVSGLEDVSEVQSTDLMSDFNKKLNSAMEQGTIGGKEPIHNLINSNLNNGVLKDHEKDSMISDFAQSINNLKLEIRPHLRLVPAN